MKKRRVWALPTAASALLLMPITAVAASPTVEVTNDDAAERCPAVQMVIINSQFDAEARQGAGRDGGFFAPVVNEVMTTNGPEFKGDRSAGFADDDKEVAAKTSTAESTPGVGADLWGLTATSQSKITSAGSSAASFASSASVKKSIGDDLWPATGSLTTVTTTPSSSSSTTAAKESSRTTSTTTTATLSSSAETKKQNVGRVYVNFDDEGGYIPGVTGEETEYNERVVAGVEKTHEVLGEIHEKCPNAQVMLMGYSEGAQVAHEVAHAIGTGQAQFPQDKIAGVALFSDPMRAESQPVVANGAPTPSGLKGQGSTTEKVMDEVEPLPAPEGSGVARVVGESTGNRPQVAKDASASRGGNTTTTGGGSMVPAIVSDGTFGALSDRVASFCLEGDSSCAIPDGPLRKLISASASKVDLNNPATSLGAIADTLGPAVVLGGVETLADDLSFGSHGFEIARAETPDESMIARVAKETDRETSLGDMASRLIVAGSKLAGMGLAAGIAFAKEVVSPANVSAIMAAGVTNPLAAVPAVVGGLASATLKVITPATATGAALRVFDEIQAAGLTEMEIADVAVAASAWRSIGSGAYTSTPVTTSGQSATDVVSSWTKAAVSDATGIPLEQLTGSDTGAGDLTGGLGSLLTSFDVAGVTDALSGLAKV